MIGSSGGYRPIPIKGVLQMKIRICALFFTLALLLAGCGSRSGGAPSSAPSENPAPPSSLGEAGPSQPSEGGGPESESEPEAITQEEAQGMVEDYFGEKDEATGFPFSIGFEGMVTLDGTDYYNFRISWLVDGDHLSYLTNYVVSLDGGEMKEYLPAS